MLKVNRKLVFRIRNLLNISIIKETLLSGNWNKLSFSKLLLTTKILLVFLIENYNSLYFLPHCSYFCFSASESLKNFMLRPNRLNIIILHLKVGLTTLGIWSGLDGKSVLYLGTMHLQRKTPPISNLRLFQRQAVLHWHVFYRVEKQPCNQKNILIFTCYWSDWKVSM